MVAALAIVVAFCGCSGQKRFARRVAGADRVTISNHTHGFTASLSSEDLSNLVRAVSSAKRESPLVAIGPEFTITFFSRTNILGAITVGMSVFSIDGVPYAPYVDRTGTLEALGPRFRDVWREHALPGSSKP